MPAKFSRTHGAPGDSEACLVKATEGAAEAAHFREEVFFGDEDIVHHDLAGDRRAQRHLAFDLREAEAVHPLLDKEAPNVAIELCPDNADVCDRTIRDPCLAAGQQVATVFSFRAGPHAAGIRAVVGLSESEAADELARC